MSKKKAAVPDAWDDDWENAADTITAKPPTPEPEVKLSKAERRAKHDEANRQLWQDADEIKEKPLFLLARKEPTTQSEFKPTMKVLSRKPPPKVTAELAGLKLDDDEDSEEEERKKAAVEYEERKARAIREREEKQRRYKEAREKLFGAEDGGSRATSTSGHESGSRNSSRGKGRGGRRDTESRGPKEDATKDQSPARLSSQRRQLFDPTYAEKSGSAYIQRRNNPEASGSGRSTPAEERPFRAPKGPDGSGRGGFGFAPRGGLTSNTS